MESANCINHNGSNKLEQLKFTAVAPSYLNCVIHNVFLKYYHSNMMNAVFLEVFLNKNFQPVSVKHRGRHPGDGLHSLSGFLLWNPGIHIFLQRHNCFSQSMCVALESHSGCNFQLYSGK